MRLSREEQEALRERAHYATDECCSWQEHASTCNRVYAALCAAVLVARRWAVEVARGGACEKCSEMHCQILRGVAARIAVGPGGK